MTAAKVEGDIGGVRVETEWFETAWAAQDWATSHCTRWRLVDGTDGSAGNWHEEADHE